MEKRFPLITIVSYICAYLLCVYEDRFVIVVLQGIDAKLNLCATPTEVKPDI